MTDRSPRRQACEIGSPTISGWAGVETEPFRAFRLTQFDAATATDGELLGAFLRCIVEMSSRDQSGAVVEHLRHQANLAEAILPPRAERPPAPKRHPWRRYASYTPSPVEEGQPSPEEAEKQEQPAKDKTVAVDAALDTEEVLAEAVLPDDDESPDESPFDRPDRKLQEQRLRDAVEDEFEKDAAYRREADQFEADLLALVEGHEGGRE